MINISTKSEVQKAPSFVYMNIPWYKKPPLGQDPFREHSRLGSAALGRWGGGLDVGDPEQVQFTANFVNCVLANFEPPKSRAQDSVQFSFQFEDATLANLVGRSIDNSDKPSFKESSMLGDACCAFAGFLASESHEDLFSECSEITQACSAYLKK